MTIVAVSKQQPATAIKEAFHAGQRHFGESYAQEALAKMIVLPDLEIVWHFVGRLQSNKTRPVAEHFEWVHTVDRYKLAERLSAQRPFHAAALNVLIQVNIANEPQKAGVPPDDTLLLARRIRTLPRLALRGLMCIPPQQGKAETWFERLAALRETLRENGVALDTLSMGMSADFEAAIARGSTCVRIGTAIFGARNPRQET